MDKPNKYNKLFLAYQRIKKLGVDATADTGKYKYDFVSLGKFKDIVDPILEEIKIGYTQPLAIINDKNCLLTIVYDAETGKEIISSSIILKPRSDTNPQDWGSSITYFRRYSLFSIFGIVGDKDDDCLISNEDVVKRIDSCSSIKELMKLYDSVHETQKEDLKDAFTTKKLEFQQQINKENENILKNTKINEG